MKIRQGFVSNSSSSSFCIHKQYMTKEQVEEFRQILAKLRNSVDNDDYETNIFEDGHYFLGELSMHNETIHHFLSKLEKGSYSETT